MRLALISLLTVAALTGSAGAETIRSSKSIKNWDFSRDSVNWQQVRIPHDWAIYGPFSRDNDLQKVAVTQNGEKEETWKTGRTGGLPFIGKGFYKTSVEIDDTTAQSFTLLFDGAMSRATVSVNGEKAIFWPYGYNSFFVGIDSLIHPGKNTIEVSLENLPESSRWYPGAGLYRNVHLLNHNKKHIPVWGTQLTTPYISKDYATIKLQTKIEGFQKGEHLALTTIIYNPKGEKVAEDSHPYYCIPGERMLQNLRVNHPELWSPEAPNLYKAETFLIQDGKILDKFQTRFGFRTVEVRSGEGFFLNGEKRKIKGVCNHHDLGPLGAAVNREAIRHQLELLKDMGADAIRTSHNMPAPELVELCDEMGIMLMLEPFDDWGFRPKCKNGYGSIFDEWAEKDMVNMLHQFRNSPSVVMWSTGNEVPSQWGPDGVTELKMLQEIIHREDPTRPVTNGMDQFDAVINNGFASAVDVPGFNYKVNRYKEAYPKLPQNIILGSETCSTVSSRGQYMFPPVVGANIMHPGNQSNSYDTEYCYWSNLPDDDFAADDDLPYNIGQFVWTGFDYLGEPTPYDTDAWPSHSSYFGIMDLASIPKDRYWLYRSKWNNADQTLHILPHWTWPGREGENTPVFVYTDSPRAELFVNGESKGIREKALSPDTTLGRAQNMPRYRLMWNDVVYQPGEIRVVTYDNEGNTTGEKTIRTAGKPYRLVAVANKTTLSANAEDLIYITIMAEDKNGNPVPYADNDFSIKVKGAATFRAQANGDATSLLPFHQPAGKLFSGKATAIIQSKESPGPVSVTITSKGLKPMTLNFNSK